MKILSNYILRQLRSSLSVARTKNQLGFDSDTIDVIHKKGTQQCYKTLYAFQNAIFMKILSNYIIRHFCPSPSIARTKNQLSIDSDTIAVIHKKGMQQCYKTLYAFQKYYSVMKHNVTMVFYSFIHFQKHYETQSHQKGMQQCYKTLYAFQEYYFVMKILSN
jgi:hypothetical protein